ncbi:MAG: S8 family serine peptidase [Lachnospiraceae bacterium]|nr:S8 family serine peptidase [Lachnospiraceae bacterium]
MQKIENLLNLALETPLQERMQTIDLNEGYSVRDNTWELIVKYNGSLDFLRNAGIEAEELIAGYGILVVPEDLIPLVANRPEIEYIEMPKRLFFSLRQGKEASCIFPITQREPFLTGKGVLVAVIDSGIDYESSFFRNLDGSSRIVEFWDQSTGKIFDNNTINMLLLNNRESLFFERPSPDVSGHGTLVTQIAAGSPAGVAPESELLIVKLGQSVGDSFPRTTGLMRALTYVTKKAQELGRPVAINLSFGNTYGSHQGTSLLERFIDNVAEIGRTVICVGTGNEAASGGSVRGVLSQVGLSQELTVGPYETTLNLQIWKEYVDQFQITVVSPSGQRISVPDLYVGSGKSVVSLEDTKLLIYVGEPSPYSTMQEIYFEFLPMGNYITQGIWTFVLTPVRVVTGEYAFYLPSQAARSTDTRLVGATPEGTFTIPSTASRVVRVGAYDARYDSYADFSGRGLNGNYPDLVAPGVDIRVPIEGESDRIVSGTSFATPFVTGSATLLMEWGIIGRRDPFLYGEKIKAYLQSGARPIRGEREYPNPKVGYGALCLEESLPIYI